MLTTLVSNLTRPQILAALSDESVSDDVLRGALLHCLNGSVAAAPVAAAPKAKAKAKAPAVPAAAAGLAPGSPAAITPPAAPSASSAVVTALLGSGAGFAVADVIAAGGGTRSQVGTAIKHAVKAGTCFKAGERRFTRYAATLAIATAASVASRG